MSVYASIAHDFSGMLGLLKGALSRLQKRVAKAEGFIYRQ